MDDLLAVMDAAGSERVALFGTLEGGPMAALFAATYPERVSALVLYATFARATWAPGYELAWPAEVRDQKMAEQVEHWGEGRIVAGVAPQRDGRSELHRVGRAARAARGLAGHDPRGSSTLIGEFDVRDVLPSIRVPTLVMHRRDDSFINIEHSRYIAEQIPDARYVELEGGDNMFSLGRQRRPARRDRGAPDRRAPRARAGPDARDRPVHRHLRLDAARRRARATAAGATCSSATTRSSAHALERHRGREVKRTGDGFLATFDGPARAIRCAASVAEAMGSLGIQVRAGLHTGELEVMDGDLGGPRRAHRRARAGSCLAERGARLGNREGPRRRIRNRVR